MRNKFLTYALCFGIKTPPKDIFSNIINIHVWWKLICKHEPIGRIANDNMVFHNFQITPILICDNKPTVPT